METDVREWLWESCDLELDVAVEPDDPMVDDAMAAFDYLRSGEGLSPERIVRAHELLLSSTDPAATGGYRDGPVRVGDRVPPAPARVRYEMRELIEERTVEDAVDALRWHVEFERIHPFEDGNGRIGRVLYLYHCDALSVEPLFFRAADREGYYGLFERLDRE